MPKFPQPFTVKRRYRITDDGKKLELSYGWGYVRRWAGRVAHAHLLDLQRAGAPRPSHDELAAWILDLIQTHGARFISYRPAPGEPTEPSKFWDRRLKDEDLDAIAATAAEWTLNRCDPDYIERRRAEGRRGGRPRVANTTDLLRCIGLSIRETALRLGISTATVSRLRAQARAMAELARKHCRNRVSSRSADRKNHEQLGSTEPTDAVGYTGATVRTTDGRSRGALRRRSRSTRALHLRTHMGRAAGQLVPPQAPNPRMPHLLAGGVGTGEAGAQGSPGARHDVRVPAGHRAGTGLCEPRGSPSGTVAVLVRMRRAVDGSDLRPTHGPLLPWSFPETS